MINIIFLGTPQIAVNSIMKLLNFSDIHILAVVTPKDKPSGRGNKITPCPVKICAEKNGIQVFQTDSISKDKELIKILKDLNPDYFITFAFGQILSQEVLDIPQKQTINLHASLLPKYRGANPIQRCIYNGDSETGITTMLTELKLDAGPICLQQKIEITKNMTSCELEEKISNDSPFLLYRTLKGLETNTIQPLKQDEAQVCFANKFTKEDTQISWKETSSEIHNKVRAFANKPYAYIVYKGKNIKIIETELTDICNDNSCQTGEIIKTSKQGIEVKTTDGSILIKKVQPESKSIMESSAWANGMQFNKNENLAE